MSESARQHAVSSSITRNNAVSRARDRVYKSLDKTEPMEVRVSAFIEDSHLDPDGPAVKHMVSQFLAIQDACDQLYERIVIDKRDHRLVSALASNTKVMLQILSTLGLPGDMDSGPRYYGAPQEIPEQAEKADQPDDTGGDPDVRAYMES